MWILLREKLSKSAIEHNHMDILNCDFIPFIIFVVFAITFTCLCLALCSFETMPKIFIVVYLAFSYYVAEFGFQAR